MTQTQTSKTHARVERVRVFVFFAPCEPVRTSFGVMTERPALLVCLDDTDGAQGWCEVWCEVWCNFPQCGAEHRAALVRTLVAPELLGQTADDPGTVFAALEAKFAVLTLQSGEPGLLAQVLAGIDQSLWDLCARRADLPLWRLLGAESETVAVYASGIGPDVALDTALAQQAAGHRVFKLKVGFEPEADIQRVRGLRRGLGDQAKLMVDAKQACDVEQARQQCARLSDHNLEWIEEPLPADAPTRSWRELARAVPGVAPAAGENLIGRLRFDEALDEAILSVIQPDVTKWGGITGCLAVGRTALARGRRYCPHFLGTGIGLAMSAHLLATVGGDGLLDIDVNPNPLRDLLASGMSPVREGFVSLSDEPGFEPAPDLSLLSPFQKFQ